MNNSQAIVNFMFFGNNYPDGFIKEVWPGSLGEHLTIKFNGFYEKYRTQTFFRWYMELDHENKEKLNHWVEHNYSHKRKG